MTCKKILRSLTEEKNYHLLFEYIWNENLSESEEKRKNFAFVASELITSSNERMKIAIGINWNILYDYLNAYNDGIISEKIVGFYCKVWISILSNFPTMAVEFIKENRAVDIFIQKCTNMSIVEVIIKVLSLEQEDIKVFDWFNEQDCSIKILSLLDPNQSPNSHYSCTELLNEIINLSESSEISAEQLLAPFKTKASIVKLLQYCQSGSDSFINCICFFSALIKRYSIKSNPQNISSIDLTEFKSTLCDNIDVFVSVLTNQEKKEIPSTTGPIISLGIERLESIRLLSQFLQLSDNEIIQKYQEKEICKIFLSFFFRFPLNNFLHSIIVEAMKIIFTEDQCEPLMKTLFVDLQITHRIIEAQGKNDEIVANGGMRLGYMGHLTLISEEIIKLSNSNRTIVSEVSQWTSEKEWTDYLYQSHKIIQDKNNSVLAGQKPPSIMEMISDEETEAAINDTEKLALFLRQKFVAENNEDVDEVDFGFAEEIEDPEDKYNSNNQSIGLSIPISTGFENILSIPSESDESEEDLSMEDTCKFSSSPISTVQWIADFSNAFPKTMQKPDTTESTFSNTDINKDKE